MISDVLNSYTSRISANGATNRDYTLNALKYKLSNEVPDLISTREVKVSLPNTSVQTDQSFGIFYSDDLNTRLIRALPDQTVTPGSLILYENVYWMVTDVDVETEVYQKAFMERCNYILKFKNSDGDVVSKYCVIKDVTKYLVGENTKDQLVIGDSRMSLRVAKDNDTIQFKRGTRFIVDDIDAGESISYEITKPDRVTKRYMGDGIYMFLIRETNVLPSDDVSNNISEQPDYEPGMPGLSSEGGWF